MYQVVIKENKTIPRTSWIVFLCWGFVVGSNAWIGFREGKPHLIWISVFFAGIAILIHFYFLLKYWFWRLELGTYGCCFRNRFGKRKEFHIRDVKQIGLRQKYIGGVKFRYLELVDQRDRILVSINILTAENVKSLIPFFEEHSTEVIIDSRGRIAVGSRVSEVYEHVNRGSERQINRWRRESRKWEKKPAFYQSPLWMGRIRKIGWSLHILMFVGIIAAQRFSRTVAAVAYGIIPLILISYFLLFHRILVWRTPKQTTTDWEQGHVVMPNLTLIMFPFFFWSPLMDLNFAAVEQMQFWGKLCVLLLLVFFLFAAGLRAWRKLPGLLLCILIFSYTGTYCWNYLFTPEQEPVSEAFTVLEKESTEFWKFSQYRLRVHSPNEGEILFQVSWDTYQGKKPGDTITFCIEESVFGVDYCYAED